MVKAYFNGHEIEEVELKENGKCSFYYVEPQMTANGRSYYGEATTEEIELRNE